MFNKYLTNKFLKQLDKIKYGKLYITDPDGRSYIFEGDNPEMSVSFDIKKWSVISNLLTRGDILSLIHI